MGAPIDVVHAIDARYLTGLVGTVTSLARNCSEPRRLRVTVLHQGLPREAGDVLAAAAPASTVVLRRIDDPRLAALPLPTRISPYITEVSFARVLVPDLLPHLGRALYLDADVLVLGDVVELWEAPLDGAPLAAVVDPMVPTWDAERGVQNPELVAGREETPYFNSGVLLLDAAAWRARDVTGRAVAYGTRERDRILLSDQEILNAVLGGDFVALDEAWNQSAIHLERLPSPEFEARLARTRILHYYGRLKPWDDHEPRRRVDAFWRPYAPVAAP
jgi:lipopolysaccharide biosynthesis glycosyltransferase